ncbi:MAG: 30S ribosomal protein S5 [Bacteroidota bacterium]
MGIQEKLIKINELDLKKRIIENKRVSKVIKGGRVLSFNALVVVGDGINVVGFGFGKAVDVKTAIEKATNDARKNVVRISLLNGQLPHAMRFKYNANEIFIKPARKGTGIIAGGAMRTVLELAGVTDVSAKAYGSNKHNIVIATIEALKALRTPYAIAKQRGIPLEKVFNG